MERPALGSGGKAQAPQYKDTSRPPREERRRSGPRAISYILPCPGYSVSTQFGPNFCTPPAPVAIEPELWAIQKPGRKSLEGDKVRPAKS